MEIWHKILFCVSDDIIFHSNHKLIAKKTCLFTIFIFPLQYLFTLYKLFPFPFLSAVTTWSSFIDLALVLVLLFLLVQLMASSEFCQWSRGSLCEGTLDVIKDQSLA